MSRVSGAQAFLEALKKQKVEHPAKLIGTTVTIKVRAKTFEDGTEKEFLGFYTE